MSQHLDTLKEKPGERIAVSWSGHIGMAVGEKKPGEWIRMVADEPVN